MNRKKAWCTIALIVINVIVFFFLALRGRTEDAVYMLSSGAMYVPLVEAGEYYRVFTSMFLHFDYSHLVNNMLVLALLGWQLEQVVGKWRYLIIYLGAGIGGNLLSAWAETQTMEYAVGAGASGAVFGAIGALLYIAVRNHGQIGNLSGQQIVFMVLLSLYFGFTSSGVDNFAHIGGLAAGFILAVLLYRKRYEEDSPIIWG